MENIDFNKFLCSFIDAVGEDKPSNFMSAIEKALNKQGFIYEKGEIKKYKVTKGTPYKCIKDVVTSDGELAYIKGVTYLSESDNCITDEEGDSEHYWTAGTGVLDFFIPGTPNNFIDTAKDGDVVVLTERQGSYKWIILFKSINGDTIYDHFAYCVSTESVYLGDKAGWGSRSFVTESSPATEEERKLLFGKMWENGFQWDSEKMELIDRTLRNRVKQDKKEKHVWEDGDIVRLKEDNGKKWRISKIEDGVGYRDTWFFLEMSETGIAGGVIYTSELDNEYEFVSNPTKDAEEALEKSISEIDKMIPSYLEGYTDGLKKGKTELLDNFNQNKIDNMVHHFKYTKENFLDKRVSDIYRKGITDTLEKLRKEMQ